MCYLMPLHVLSQRYNFQRCLGLIMSARETNSWSWSFVIKPWIFISMPLFKSAISPRIALSHTSSLGIVKFSRMGQTISLFRRTRERQQHSQGVIVLLLLVFKAIELKSNNSPQVPSLVEHRERKVEARTFHQGQHKEMEVHTALMKPWKGPNGLKNRSTRTLRRLNLS